ncbi:MAG: NAD(+) synthase [Bdellovibrionota bacterium]|jgi:NAD+ synthase (glutamine-hydrolysing)
MGIIKIASAALNQTALDWDSNIQNIRSAIHAAQEKEVSLLCLPELCISGYSCEDAFFKPYIINEALAELSKIVEETTDLIVSLGLPLAFEERVFNAVCLLCNKKILGFVIKQNLLDVGYYQESRWFSSWQKGLIKKITIAGQEYPIGDISFNCNGISISVKFNQSTLQKTEQTHPSAIVLCPAADYFVFDKTEERREALCVASKIFNNTYLYANLLGNESGATIFDGMTLIASNGDIKAYGPRFSYGDFLLTSCNIDIPHLHKTTKDAVTVPFSFPQAAALPTQLKVQSWENGHYLKEEEFWRVVALGVFDYLRKSHCKGVVLSLSGGVDSATCACLVALMIKLGLSDIGRDQLLKKLNLVSSFGKDDPLSEKDIVHKLFTCIYQHTRNNSDTTFNAAKKLAATLGAKFIALDIDDLVSSYLTAAEKELDRKLTWEQDDHALQNIQARVRAPNAWLFANLANALLLVTSNRSELVVGYTTMDGDTAGALAPLGGVSKPFLRDALIWLETVGLNQELKIPELHDINIQKPTAELRPTSSKQTDEDDLMPYTILSEIEVLATTKLLSPKEILVTLQKAHPELETTTITNWIKRFFQLWSRNQWKRKRAALSFHLDEAVPNQRDCCRFPAISGNFEKELAELD